MTVALRTLIVVGIAFVALCGGVSGAAAASPVDRFCVDAFPSASSTTTAGVTLYNRQASVQAVECGDFGSDGGFHPGIGVLCSLLAGAIGVKYDELGLYVDGNCSGAQLALHPDSGTAAGIICGLLSDLLVGKPWAKAFGVAAGLACTFGEPAGSWLESKREQHAAEAVWADHECLKHARHSFPLPDEWVAVACASTDQGFATLSKGTSATVDFAAVCPYPAGVTRPVGTARYGCLADFSSHPIPAPAQIVCTGRYVNAKGHRGAVDIITPAGVGIAGKAYTFPIPNGGYYYTIALGTPETGHYECQIKLDGRVLRRVPFQIR